jgi:hypothetical protein
MRTAEARLAAPVVLPVGMGTRRAGWRLARPRSRHAGERKRVARLEQEFDLALGAVLAVIGTTGDATPRHTRTRLA